MNRDIPHGLEELSTEQLDRLLQTELGKERIDRTQLVEILHVLEEREAEKPRVLNEEVRRAWENYRNAQKRSTANRPWLQAVKAAAVVVAVSALLLSAPAVAGSGFLQMIGRWTADIFHFSGTPEESAVPEDYVFETDNPGLQKVYEAACEMGIQHPVVPMWLPEEFELVQLDTYINDDFLAAEFKTSTDILSITIRKQKEPTDFTKDEENVVKYTRCAVDYFIVKNEDEIKIMWMAGMNACLISVSAHNLDTYKVIHSIYK